MSSMALTQSNVPGSAGEVLEGVDGLEVPLRGPEVRGRELDLLGEDVHPELPAEAGLVGERQQAPGEAPHVEQATGPGPGGNASSTRWNLSRCQARRIGFPRSITWW